MAQRKPFRGYWRALLLPSVLCCGCSCCGGTTGGDGSLRALATAWWPSRSRGAEAAATKPLPDSVTAANGEQAAPARANGAAAGTDSDRGLPPVVNTQGNVPDERADVTPAKAELTQRKPEAPTAQLPMPTPLPAAESTEAAGNPAPPAPERRGPPGGPGQAPAPARPQPAAAGPGKPGQPPPLPDPHQRPVPTATGMLLNVPPGESVAERALEMGSRLAAAEADRKALEAKVAQLTAALQSREQELQTAAKDVQEATDEMVQTRKQLQGWRQELEEARVRIQKQKREDIEKLKSVIALAEKVIESSSSPGYYPDKETRRQGDKETQEKEKGNER